jgi:hypothetical protein
MHPPAHPPLLHACPSAPQIVHSVVTNTRPPLTFAYLYGTSVCRLVLPLYATLCPGNLLGQPARPAVAAAMVAWMVLQVCVVGKGDWGREGEGTWEGREEAGRSMYTGRGKEARRANAKRPAL